MKRFIPFFLLIIGFLTLNAQNESLFKGGVRAGCSITQISGDDLSGFHKLGAYAGLFANVPIDRNQDWKFQMELNFIMKGSKTYTPPKSEFPQYIYKLNLYYIEVPLLFKYVGLSNLEFEFGPAINILFSYKETENNYPIIGRPKFSIFELSGMAGIGYYFKEHYGFSLRYSNSLIPIRKPNWAVNRWIKKQMNSCIMLTFNYQF